MLRHGDNGLRLTGAEVADLHDVLAKFVSTAEKAERDGHDLGFETIAITSMANTLLAKTNQTAARVNRAGLRALLEQPYIRPPEFDEAHTIMDPAEAELALSALREVRTREESPTLGHNSSLVERVRVSLRQYDDHEREIRRRAHGQQT